MRAARGNKVLLFLHGSGDTGEGVKAWLEMCGGKALLERMEALGVRVVFPTAKPRPYTLAAGESINVWHNRRALAMESPEDSAGMRATQQTLLQLLASLQATPSSTVVGGFSMGGGMALWTALASHEHAFAGVFALSSFLANDSQVHTSLATNPPSPLPPLFMAHGSVDGLVPFAFGKSTHARLVQAGLQGPFLPLPGVDHSMDEGEVAALLAWLEDVFRKME